MRLGSNEILAIAREQDASLRRILGCASRPGEVKTSDKISEGKAIERPPRATPGHFLSESVNPKLERRRQAGDVSGDDGSQGMREW